MVPPAEQVSGPPLSSPAMSLLEPEGAVFVSTHDLRVAGRLREAFEEVGYRVELITPGEALTAGASRPLLLILSGDLKSESAAALSRQARLEQRIPVFGIGREGEEGLRKVARALDLQEVFSYPPDPAEVVLLGRRLMERRRLQEITGIVGETESIREALERVLQFAPVHATVLVTGESGTGKELVARGIHALSPRRHKAFLAVNVAALPDTLLESELFGHEKGAFTGAIDSRRGLFELAQGGTIFLDEIGEMPLATQTKLLRVLEEREFFRVGGERAVRVDVRVIAATNQELRHLVEVGEFRRDLYYRLNVLRIHLSPLRERRQDIPLLVEAFLREAGARHGRRFVGVSPEAMEILERYDWPGNVRELRNLVESLVVLAPGRRIEAHDIPPEIRNPYSRGLLPAPLSLAPLRARVEKAGSFRPELEFVFRTLMALRMDVEELRREFQRFKEEHFALGDELPPVAVRGSLASPRPREIVQEALEPPALAEAEAPYGARRGSLPPGVGFDGEEGGREEFVEARAAAPTTGEEGAVVYRPGMTMDQVEAEVIRAALTEVRGNRRRAAERLGIGERTLYRKIKEYGLVDQ